MLPANSTPRAAWGARLDRFCAVCGALVPVGLVMGNAGFESFIGLAVLGWVLRLIFLKETPWKSLFAHPVVKPWFFWYLIIAASLLFNGSGSKGWAHDLLFFRYFLFGLALLDISRRMQISNYFLYGLAAGVVWAALNTLSAYIWQHDFLGKPLIRYTGKLKEASRISGMTAYAAPLFSLWAVEKDRQPKGKHKLVLNAVGILAFMLVFQTRVRTSILAAITGSLFHMLYLLRRRMSVKKILWFLTIFVAICLVAFLLMPKKSVYRLSSLYDRIYYWKVAWRMWVDHPLLGVGISSFQDVYKQMASSGELSGFAAPDGVVYQLAEQTHAHNLVFMLLACTGLLGLGAFAWLFVITFGLIIEKISLLGSGFISWPVVLLVIGLTGFNIYHSWYQALLAYFLIWIGSINGQRKV